MIYSNSYDETINIGIELGKKLIKTGGYIAMYGDRGAGKTAFVSGLAKGLGYDGDVSSPTYTIMHEYSGKIPLYHFDMYRIYDEDSLYSTGYYDYVGTKSVIAVEWSENIPFALPKSYIKITITQGQDENQRIINIENIN